jgi:hypothetical protein
MERVLQVIGTLLVVGVLFLAVLMYSNVTGFAPVLTQIKDGVAKLVGWFIPEKYSIEIVGEDILGVTVNGRTIKLENVTANGIIAHIVVKFTAKDNYPNVRLVVLPELNAGSVSLSVVSKANATVVIDGLEVNIYPTGGDAEVDIGIQLTGAGTGVSGSITVAEVRY